MKVIVDSDGLIGLSNKKDSHYLDSVDLLGKLQKWGVELIYPVTMLAEATAVLQIRLNKQEAANLILESIKSGEFEIEPVDDSLLLIAIRYLQSSRNKHITLFDGIIAAVAEKYQADAIFSFDKFYKSQGFKLASELV
jgi:predicted nucleic acid-binding protein